MTHSHSYTAQQLIDALKELLWVFESESIQSALVMAAIHGCGETKETPRIQAALARAKQIVDSTTATDSEGDKS